MSIAEPDYEMYCNCCEVDGKPAQMVIKGGNWVCPNCGVTKPMDDPPFVCTTCGGPWPTCMEHCLLFKD